MKKDDKKTPEENPIAWISGESLDMQKAIQAAQDSFGEFLEELQLERQRNLPAHEASLIKYAFDAHTSGVEVEHMFLSNILFEKDALSAELVSEPQHTSDVSYGDRIIVDTSKVSDWLYVINGIGTGGYTFKVLWDRFSNNEKQLYGSEPPYLWIDKD